jgi:hypothetical protein
MRKIFLSAFAGMIAMAISATAYAVHIDLGSASMSSAQAPAHTERGL